MHDLHQDGQQAEQQHRHRDAQHIAAAEEGEPGAVLIGDVHVLAARPGEVRPWMADSIPSVTISELSLR
jgi:hypothetical protein